MLLLIFALFFDIFAMIYLRGVGDVGSIYSLMKQAVDDTHI